MITKLPDSHFNVKIQIQDGIEDCGTYSTKEDAIAAFYKYHRLLNGWDDRMCLVNKPEIFEYQLISEYRLIRIE